jgi:hypothetical protein
VLVIVVAGAIWAFVSPSPHEVHSPGAETLTTQLVYSDPPVNFLQAVQPSQSLNDVRCAMWRVGRSQSSVCPDAATLAAQYFPKLTQSPRTLYVPWLECPYDMHAAGFNVEYQPSRHAVVIHCYVATPWVWSQPQTMGAEPRPRGILLLVPTSSIPAGPVSVIEDCRVEHFGSDQSTESQLGIATIS